MKKKKKKEIPWKEFAEEMASDRFLLKYEYAIQEVEKILRKIKSVPTEGGHKRIEFITHRIKSPESVMDKLRRKGKPVTVKSAEKNLNDIAGVCAVCCYKEDVYQVAQEIEKTSGMDVVKVKDFIKTPKATGYRSLHLILELADELGGEEQKVRLELQIRTVTMDAWARLDHELRYKKGLADVDNIYADMHKCAETIAKVDDRMQEIRRKIQKIGT